MPASVGVVLFWPLLNANALAVSVALVLSVVVMAASGVTSFAVAVGVLRELSADEAQVRGMWAKSVIAPIGKGIAERIQTPPTLTAIFAVSTGVLSAAVLPVMMRGG